MLEILLMQYEDQFGEPFPLKDFAGCREIDVINIIYDCVYSNEKYTPGRKTENRITSGPGLK